MLSAPVPFQSLGDRSLIVFAPPIAVEGQALGIALAGKDGAENLHPRLAGNITDHLSQLAIHLFKGFLHMLDCS